MCRGSPKHTWVLLWYSFVRLSRKGKEKELSVSGFTRAFKDTGKMDAPTPPSVVSPYKASWIQQQRLGYSMQ